MFPSPRCPRCGEPHGAEAPCGHRRAAAARTGADRGAAAQHLQRWADEAEEEAILLFRRRRSARADRA